MGTPIDPLDIVNEVRKEKRKESPLLGGSLEDATPSPNRLESGDSIRLGCGR